MNFKKSEPAIIWKRVHYQRITSKNTRPWWVDTWARDTVRWYWSADTLFWQLSIDDNIDVQSAFSWAPNLAKKCESKHWYACGADGRSLARSLGHVITKFSGMGRFTCPWCSAGALRSRSSAQNKFIDRDNDSCKTWQLIIELTSRKPAKSSIKELKLNGVSIINAPDLSNAFNDHFSSIEPKLTNEIPLSNGNCISYQEYINGMDKSFALLMTDRF